MTLCMQTELHACFRINGIFALQISSSSGPGDIQHLTDDPGYTIGGLTVVPGVMGH